MPTVSPTNRKYEYSVSGPFVCEWIVGSVDPGRTLDTAWCKEPATWSARDISKYGDHNYLCNAHHNVLIRPKFKVKHDINI